MTVSEAQIKEWVAPYLADLPAGVLVDDSLYLQLGRYLEVLLRWNARTNLTSIREPEGIVRRHFGESLFAGCRLGEVVKPGAEALDLGSGAGFPGIPVQLLLPGVKVVLAESQGKKAAFLREVVRELGLSCKVVAGRVEAMEAGRRFDAVMMRAVDKMEAMVTVGRSRLKEGGVLLEMTGDGAGRGRVFAMPERAGSFVRLRWADDFCVVPRGTTGRVEGAG